MAEDAGSRRGAADPEASSRPGPRGGPGPPGGWMEWFDRWGLNGRMLLAAGLPVLLVVVTAVFLSLQVSDLQQLHDRETEAENDLAAAGDLESSFGALVEASQRYVLTGDTQNRSRLDSRLSAFETALSERQEPLGEAAHQSQVRSLDENATAYIERVRRAQGEMENGNQEAAQNLLTRPGTDQLRSRAESALQAIRQSEQQTLEERQSALAAAQDDLQQELVFASLGVLVVSAAVAYGVTRRTRSTVNRHLSTLQARLNELEAVCKAASEHTERQRAAVIESRSALADAERGAGGIQDRVSQTAQMADTVEGWAAEGHRRIDATLNAIEETEDTVTTVTDHVLDMSDRIDQVADVADDISSLSSQIDMLALNASVEASRVGEDAGELGEVRAMAERAQDRAERIAEIVEEARDEASAATVAIEDSGDALEEIETNVGDAEDWVEQLEASLADNREQVAGISSVAESQSAALEEAMAELEGSRDDSEELEEATQRARQLVDELETVADGLSTMSGGER